MSNVTPKLSVVVPCYNEEATIPHFFERMTLACQAAAGGAYEIIFVNDGSWDNTWASVRAMALTRPGVVALNLSRNHGHQLAVTAGLSRARGERVLVIDADLQDPPELLGVMMAPEQAKDRRAARCGSRSRRRREGGRPAPGRPVRRAVAEVDPAVPADARRQAADRAAVGARDQVGWVPGLRLHRRRPGDDPHPQRPRLDGALPGDRPRRLGPEGALGSHRRRGGDP